MFQLFYFTFYLFIYLFIFLLIAKITTRPTDKIAAYASAAEWLLTPKRRASGKFHYPTAGGVFKKLQNEDKDLFSFRNCKK